MVHIGRENGGLFINVRLYMIYPMLVIVGQKLCFYCSLWFLNTSSVEFLQVCRVNSQSLRLADY